MALDSDFLQQGYQYFLEFAATVVQRHFRGYLVRKAFYQQRRIEQVQREELERAEQIQQLHDAAACRIQGAWQCFRNRRIYNYYRDLIQFRERGDPKEMLRAINPREAALADAAAGVHVRFRLGGTTFPPLVFYKIFTHRTVTDINAFGPRNYAGEISVSAKQRHSKPTCKAKAAYREDFDLDDQLRQYLKPDGTIGYRSTRGWYERIDNNGWRPISERLLLGEDPVTMATSLQSKHFHHNPVVRRAQRVQHAKQRRREWLRKMYIMDQSNAEGREQGDLPQLPGCCLAQLRDEDLDDLQVDELLEWSQHLDFHSYTSDWTSTACTLGSEAFMPPTSTAIAYAAPLPAPDFSVHTAMAAAGVPLLPHKGGVGPATGITSLVLSS